MLQSYKIKHDRLYVVGYNPDHINQHTKQYWIGVAHYSPREGSGPFQVYKTFDDIDEARQELNSL
jgi:hypothetical protein